MQWNPWGPSLYDTQIVTYLSGQPLVPINQPFVCRWTTPTMAHAIWVNTTQETATAEAHEVYLRTLCHWLLDQLPVRAVPELVTSLLQMREFYAAPPTAEPPKLSSRMPLTKTTRVQAREVELPDEE